jgi:hypothetical protein
VEILVRASQDLEKLPEYDDLQTLRALTPQLLGIWRRSRRINNMGEAAIGIVAMSLQKQHSPVNTNQDRPSVIG